MNNQNRKPFRPRPMKSNFRRNNGPRSNNNGHFQNNTGNSFSRNGSMTNPFNVEKTIQKYQQLAKDAQSGGDPVLVENYLQHADHYLRRYNELNQKRESLIEKVEPNKESSPKEETLEEDMQQIRN